MFTLRQVVEQLGYEIIDAHTNVGKFPFLELPQNQSWDTEVTALNLLAEMDKTGVGTSIMCSFEGLFYNYHSANKKLASIQRQSGGRLHGFASVHPLIESAASDLAHAARDLGLRGLKLHPRVQQFDPTCAEVRDILEQCCELSLPVMFHCGTTHRSCHPTTLVQLAKDFPQILFVFAHMGGTNVHITVEAVYKLDNILLETSVSRPVFDPIRRAANSLGSDRILFGSDFPCGSVAVELFRILDAGFRDGDLKNILHDNALRLLSFSGPIVA
jgi:uncharacterized protein